MHPPSSASHPLIPAACWGSIRVCNSPLSSRVRGHCSNLSPFYWVYTTGTRDGGLFVFDWHINMRRVSWQRVLGARKHVKRPSASTVVASSTGALASASLLRFLTIVIESGRALALSKSCGLGIGSVSECF